MRRGSAFFCSVSCAHSFSFIFRYLWGSIPTLHAPSNFLSRLEFCATRTPCVRDWCDGGMHARLSTHFLKGRPCARTVYPFGKLMASVGLYSFFFFGMKPLTRHAAWAFTPAILCLFFILITSCLETSQGKIRSKRVAILHSSFHLKDTASTLGEPVRIERGSPLCQEINFNFFYFLFIAHACFLKKCLASGFF